MKTTKQNSVTAPVSLLAVRPDVFRAVPTAYGAPVPCYLKRVMDTPYGGLWQPVWVGGYSGSTEPGTLADGVALIDAAVRARA